MPIYKEDLQSIPWEEALDNVDFPVTWRYAIEFKKRAEAVQSRSESTAEKVYKLLHTVTSPYLKTEMDEGPFPRLQKLEENDHAILEIILDETDDPDLKARIADVLWVQVGYDEEITPMAIEAYVEAARTLEDAYRNTQPALDRFNRALSLSAQLKQREEVVVDAIESRIRDRSESETWWYSLHYSRLLYENQEGHPEEQAQLMTACAENIQERYESSEDLDSDLNTAKDYFLLAAKWHDEAEHLKAARQARIRGTELLVQKAKSAPSQMNAASWYRDALKLYRSIPDTDEQTEEVHRLMLDAQENIRDEMVPVSWAPSNPELQREAREHVDGLSLQTALTRLAHSLSSPTLDEVEARAKERAQADPCKAFVPEERMNEMGHTISNKPGGFEQEEEILKYLMHRVMSRVRTRVAVNFIRPARNQITEDHYVRRQNLVEFARYSLFVAEGRLLSISKGLLAGFKEDWVTVAHLLAPQLEAGLRHLLRQRGVITTGLDTQNIQEQKSLNRMLAEDSLRSPLEEMLARNVVYDLEGLLTESSGANLRNLVAHGLSDDGRYWSPPVEYMWWTTLRLISYFSVRGIDGSNTETQE